MKRYLLIALLLVACGGKVKPADPQTDGQLQLPDFEAKGKAPFALTDEQTDVTYKGNILFWDPRVTPAQIERVSNASVNGRKVRASYLAFHRDERHPVLAERDAAQAKLKLLDQKVVESRRENFDEIVELQKPLLETWAMDRLAKLEAAGKISAEDAAQAKAQFGVYCQAKLWETAANPLLSRKYASRPTPLVMCEGYYADAKLLDKTTAACADAAAGRTKDYLDCFWQEGVLKTELFGARSASKCKASDPASPLRTDAIKLWVANGSLQAELRAEFAATNGVMATGAVSDAVTQDKNVPVGLLSPDCTTAFKGKAAAPGVNTLTKPLGFLLNIVEASVPTLQANPFGIELLIPGTTEEEILGRYVLLADDLRTFSARAGGPSVNDRIFNNDAQRSVQESKDIRAQYEAAKGFANVRQVEADYVPAALKSERATTVKTLDASNARLVELEKNELKLDTDVANVLQEGALASMEEGVSLMFVAFTIRLTRIEDRIEARLSIRDPKAARSAIGCTTVAGQPCEATRAAGEESFDTLSKVQFDGEKNELVVELPLVDPAAQGLVFEASETKHNLIAADELSGQTLRLSAYSNQMDGLLDFFTGKAELLENGKAQREGSISGDAYDANLAIWK